MKQSSAADHHYGASGYLRSAERSDADANLGGLTLQGIDDNAEV